MIYFLCILLNHPHSEATPNSKITGAYYTVHNTRPGCQPLLHRLAAYIALLHWIIFVTNFSNYPQSIKFKKTRRD